MTLAEQLNLLPAGVVAASELIDRFDDCLGLGFARLNRAQHDDLQRLVACFAGSPLEVSLHDAVSAIEKNEFLIRHFLVLAAARTALQGSQYDALQAHLRSVLKRKAYEIQPPLPQASHAYADAFSSTQQWLTEIAITGFQHLEENAVAPFQATLENLQSSAELTGLAALLTGFVNELLCSMPTERQGMLPIFRWADLWAAAMIRTQSTSLATPGCCVSGTVSPLGIDVRMHANFAAVHVYGILQTADQTCPIRIPLNAYKVDVIHGPEIWDLFGELSDPILLALQGRRQLEVDQAELRTNSDLVLRTCPVQGRTIDPFEWVDRFDSLPSLPPIARHPVHLAELVCVPGNCGLPIASERLGSICEFDDKLLGNARQIIGLLRFDRGWRLQPLAVQSGKTTVVGGELQAKLRGKLKTKTLATLRERSGKLLRG